MRFRSKSLRLAAVILTISKSFLYMGICLYAPTLALAAVTPLDITTYFVIVGIVCTIYSTIGGVRAVVWTDVFQLAIMFLGILTAAVVACVEVGGVGKVWQIAGEGHRLDIWEPSLSLHKRHTLWNVLFHGFLYWMAVCGINQVNLQRICSVGTLKEAKMLLYSNIVGLLFMWILLFFAGLGAYAVYSKCDPIKAGLIGQKDEILPYLIMDKIGYIYGMPGLFVAALFGGALSSLSSVINALVAMIWVDLLQRIPYFKNSSPTVAARTNKILSVIVGAVMIGMAFVASEIEGLIQGGMTVIGITLGPLLGVFLLGVLFPWCGKTGCWAGLLLSWALTAWISLGGYFNASKPVTLPFSTDGCPPNQTLPLNLTLSTNLTHSSQLEYFPVAMETSSSGVLEDSTDPAILPMSLNVTTSYDNGEDRQSALMSLYKISYTLTMPFGAILCFVTGMLVTCFTGKEDPANYSPELILPALRPYFYP